MQLGNARTALFSALWARRAGGRFLLRIEDTDAGRSTVEFAAGLLEDLAWLGITWDGEVLHQSSRRAAHDAALEKLLAAGAAYPCFCTPEELERERAAQHAAGRPPRYSGRCRELDAVQARRRLAAGEPGALRFRVPAEGAVTFDDLVHGPMQFRCADLGDFVLRRADGTPAFFFGNALDDADSGVTVVLRGEDHLANTPRQLLLLAALGRAPPRYGHLALLLGADNRPLSKRRGAQSLAELREAGYLPAAIRNLLYRLGHHCGDEELLGLDVMAAAFDPAHLQKAAAHFDPVQLRGWQKRAALALHPAARLAWLAPVLPAGLDDAERDAFVAAIAPNLVLPDDARAWVEVTFGEPPQPDVPARAALAGAPPLLFQAALRALEAGAGFREMSAAAGAESGLKGPALFKPLRAALTGRLDGPELGALLPAMGSARARARLARFA
jgi:glutamyl-tRNA synthetase